MVDRFSQEEFAVYVGGGRSNSNKMSRSRSSVTSSVTGALNRTRERRSTLRTSASRQDKEPEIIEVKYLDGKKEKANGLTRDGKVFAKYSNGDIYEGNVVSAGKEKGFHKSGKGVYTWASGAVYDGYYKKNVKHGKGTYITASKVKFEGRFENGVKN